MGLFYTVKCLNQKINDYENVTDTVFLENYICDVGKSMKTCNSPQIWL